MHETPRLQRENEMTEVGLYAYHVSGIVDHVLSTGVNPILVPAQVDAEQEFVRKHWCA